MQKEWPVGLACKEELQGHAIREKLHFPLYASLYHLNLLHVHITISIIKKKERERESSVFFLKKLDCAP